MPHPGCGELGIAQQPGRIGKTESFREIYDRARRLLAADHDEMPLVAVQPREEREARLVEARRGLEDVSRKGHRGGEDFAKTGRVARCQASERGGSGRCDRVENAEQRIGMAFPVAFDQFGIVEIVPGVHAHACRKTPAHVDFLLSIEKRDLDTVDPGAVGFDHREGRVHRPAVILLAPVAGERAQAASARLAMSTMRPPSLSIASHCSSYAATTSSSVTPAEGAS